MKLKIINGGVIMRIWHKDLIPVLPRKQLLSQWRELSAIVGAINKNGTPNHPLVNKVLDYDKNHLTTYASFIAQEMHGRGYKVSDNVYDKIMDYADMYIINYDNLYAGWHDIRYLRQCYYNLEEKYDCCMITKEEFGKIEDVFVNAIANHIQEG